jgi:hypothetical protein
MICRSPTNMFRGTIHFKAAAHNSGVGGQNKP